MLGAGEPYAAVPWFWSDQYDGTPQVAGLGDGADLTVERDLGAGRLVFQVDAEGRLMAAGGVGPNGLVARGRTRRDADRPPRPSRRPASG